jgi:hypothetical protein
MPPSNDIVDVRVDARTFEGAMNQFIALKRIALRDGLRFQAGLLAGELLRDTPPQAGTVTLDGATQALGARRAGQARAERDLRRAVRPLNPKQWSDPGIATLIRRRKYDVLQRVFARFSNLQIVPFAPGLHAEARDEDGRVRRSRNVATPDLMAHAAYARKLRGRVGIAKGGWAAAMIGLGRRPPSWVLPFAKYGSLRDGSAEPEPSVSMVNDSAWAGGRYAQIIIRSAMTRRQGRMERWIEGALRARARRAGLA